MPYSNMPPHVYFMMWKYLRNATQMFMQRKRHGFSNRGSVDAAMSGNAVFLGESGNTLF